MRWTALALLAATAAGAEPRLVTNPEMCALSDPIDTQEMGMELGANSLSEIEYYCEFEPAIAFDWTGDVVTTRLGWCSEPGVISPMLVTFQYGAYEPGVVNVWWQDADAPTRFERCPG